MHACWITLTSHGLETGENSTLHFHLYHFHID